MNVCMYALRRFSDDPLDVVHTVRYDPDGEEERPVKKSETPLSLWMRKYRTIVAS